MASRKGKKTGLHFKTMTQSDVPQGRRGKHRLIVAAILNDLGQLKNGGALKIPLAELVESKAKVRAALNRATRKAGRTVATASDTNFLYVWNVKASSDVSHAPDSDGNL